MLRRFQGGRTVRRTHRTARVVAGLLGFSLVWREDGSLVRDAANVAPELIAHVIVRAVNLTLVVRGDEHVPDDDAREK